MRSASTVSLSRHEVRHGQVWPSALLPPLHDSEGLNACLTPSELQPLFILMSDDWSLRASCKAITKAPSLQQQEMRVATWNIAAVNNNPFEYWITHSDADYNKLMEDVQSFIDQPGVHQHRSPSSLLAACDTCAAD